MHKTIEWAAGLFEGEGCLTLVKDGRWHLQLEMSDQDVVEEWHRVMGLTTKITHRPQRYGRKTKPTFMSQTRKQSEVRRCVAAMLPYLGNRRAYKALNCLDELDIKLTS